MIWDGRELFVCKCMWNELELDATFVAIDLIFGSFLFECSNVFIAVGQFQLYWCASSRGCVFLYVNCTGVQIRLRIFAVMCIVVQFRLNTGCLFFCNMICIDFQYGLCICFDMFQLRCNARN